jgi:hypothetical protein
MQAEKKFHKLTMEAGWEWVVRFDVPQVIELRNYDEPGIQHRFAIQVALAKRDS